MTCNNTAEVLPENQLPQGKINFLTAYSDMPQGNHIISVNPVDPVIQ